MIESRIGGNTWDLKLSGAALCLHRTGWPFVVAMRREKQYVSDRGTVKETVEVKERIALDTVIKTDDGCVFQSRGHSLCVKVNTEELAVSLQSGEASGSESGSSASGSEASVKVPCVTLELAGEPGWAYEFHFPAKHGEAVFGGGEQYRKMNLAGETVVNFVSEHIKAQTVIEKAVIPAKLYREKTHAEIGTYAPMPVFVTESGLMLYFDTASDGISKLRDDGYVFTFDGCPRRIRILKADSYEALGRALAGLIPNRQYLPDWCYDGMILGIQGGSETVSDKVRAMQRAGAKVCAVWCQDWSGENITVMGKQVWWNWEVDEGLYPNLKESIADLRKKGVRFFGYINPYLVVDSRLYNICKNKGYLIKTKNGEISHIKSTTFNAGMLDLTDPEAVRFIKEELIAKNMLGLGMSGWMADFGEYLPVDCVLHDGDPKELHNVWPVLWAKINREAIEEFGTGDEMFFSRSGYEGVQSYAPILWNGDQHTDTTRDYGMPCVMPASFSLGFSGVTLVHCDIGGFFSFGKMKRSPELFTRWMEMCTFSMLMRSHESIRPWANAQFDAPEVLPQTVRLTKIHAALKPYLKVLEAEAREGVPAMRPDFWKAGTFKARHDPYSYFLGDDLYVCPVIKEGVTTRNVHLPDGDWIGFFDGQPYRGGTTFKMDAPLGQIPVFYREESRFADLFRAAAEV